MITWLFDRRNQWGYLPNLIKDETLKPKSDAWWDLCINPPYSGEFRFLKYCRLEVVEHRCALVNDIWKTPAYYPIHLELYDSTIDYLSLMDPESLIRLKAGEFKLLFYYSEGDDPTVEILEHLHKMLSHHDVKFENIKFVTANWLINNEHPFLYFPDDELYYRYLHCANREPTWVDNVNLKPRDKKFTCLVRTDKLWRRIFCSGLHDLGLTQENYFSYTGHEYQTSYIDEDNLENWNEVGDSIASVLASFSLQIPYHCDNLSDDDHNNHKLIHKEYFQNAYWNFVVETHFNQNTCFLTEKTFKPILNLQPFIIVGNCYSLKLLKHLGYRTFGDIINERYDEMTNPSTRMQELYQLCYSVCSMPHKEHVHVMHHIKEVLEYNQKHLLSPKVQRIRNLISYLEY